MEDEAGNIEWAQRVLLEEPFNPPDHRGGFGLAGETRGELGMPGVLRGDQGEEYQDEQVELVLAVSGEVCPQAGLEGIEGRLGRVSLCLTRS
ncbi:hypothetical protein [Deinococcus peraridilitoris]|uniref:hypothetical protein n=1 Tax=Deinococcus peraridilitoris TaxID=432329 RepID=UPI000305B41C|nr:hypothetical protein [Deinococcus peraridilitoris]